MEPVRIKAYGLVNFTKKQYIITQSIVFLSIVLLFTLGLFVNLDRIFFKYFTYLLAFVTVMEIGETVIMIYKFRKKELTVSESNNTTND